MKKLTKLEKEIAVRAMEFVRAGEWPWAPNEDGTPKKEVSRDQAAMDRAIQKLSE
jgi:hypothetical protein